MVKIPVRSLLAVLGLCGGLPACGLPGYSGVENPNIHLDAGPGTFGNRPFAMTSITAARRIAVMGSKRSKGEDAGYIICSEGPPTAAENVASSFGASVAASLPSGPNVGGDVARQLATAYQVLRQTTQGLDYLDKAENAACKMHLNGAIDEQQYYEVFNRIVDNAAELVRIELAQGFAQQAFSAAAIVIPTFPEGERATIADKLFSNVFLRVPAVEGQISEQNAVLEGSGS